MAELEGLDDELEGAAGGALELLDALDQLSGALGSTASAVGPLLESLSRLSEGLGAVEAAAGAAGNAVEGIGGGASAGASGMDKLGQSLFTSTTHALDLPGPIGAIQSALGKLGPEGQAAALALGVLTIAFTVFVVAIAGGIAAAVEVNQHLELMRARFDALAGGSKAGGQVLSMVQALGRELPFAQAQIESWATSLQAAGFKGRGLEDAIRATAAATALMGESGGAAAQDLIKRLAEGGQGADKMMRSIQEGAGKSNKLLAEMGLTTADVAAAAGLTPDKFKSATLSAEQMNGAIEKALSAKGKGSLAAMMGDPAVIFGKVKEGLASAFEGLAPMVQPFMGAVKSIASEFMRGGTAVNILRAIVTPVFGTLLSWGTKAINALHKGFLMIAIGALQLYIHLRPAIDAIKAFATSESFLRGLKVAFIAIGIAVAVAALPFIIFAGVTVLMLAAIGALVAGILWFAGTIWGFIGDAASALGGWLSGAASAAGDFISGLVQGIESGAGAVVDAVKNLASAALASFKGIFGIASPSKVMLEHGEDNIAGATATGIDRGAGQVDDAMARLGDGEKPGGGSGSKSNRAKSGRGKIAETINMYYQGPASDFATFRAQAEQWLEELAAEGPQPEAT